MRCAGAGSTDGGLLLQLEERRGVEAGGVGGGLGPFRGRWCVPLGQTFSRVAEDGERLRDGIQGRSFVEGIQAYGPRR